jgi:hypothetical protein
MRVGHYQRIRLITGDVRNIGRAFPSLTAQPRVDNQFHSLLRTAGGQAVLVGGTGGDTWV